MEFTRLVKLGKLVQARKGMPLSILRFIDRNVLFI